MYAKNAADLANIARGRRKELGWTQQQLADKVGVNRFWVTDFENGKSTVALRFVLKTLSVLGLHLKLEDHRDKGPIDLDDMLSNLVQEEDFDL